MNSYNGVCSLLIGKEFYDVKWRLTSKAPCKSHTSLTGLSMSRSSKKLLSRRRTNCSSRGFTYILTSVTTARMNICFLLPMASRRRLDAASRQSRQKPEHRRDLASGRPVTFLSNKRCLPPASFRFHLAIDTLAIGCAIPAIRARSGLTSVS